MNDVWAMAGGDTPKVPVPVTAGFSDRGPVLSVTWAFDHAFPEQARDPGGHDASSFTNFFLHPEANLALISSGYSVGRFTIEKTVPEDSEAWRWVRVGTYSVLATAGGYLAHEAGHFHHNSEDEGPTSDGHIGFYDALSTLGGINANLEAAQALLLRPYEGEMSDIAYLVHKMDPFFYEVGQEFLVFDGLKYGDSEGDMAGYRRFRHGRSDRFDEGSTTALAFWSLADTVPAIHRLFRYGRTGEHAENPYGSGGWALKTTGALSPIGVRLGLRGYYFLEGHNDMPSALSTEIWSSPVRQGGEEVDFPFGVEMAATRMPLPLRLGAHRIAASGRFVYSRQEAAGWKITEDLPLWDTNLLAGGGGVHFQAEVGEFFTQVFYKEKGFIPRELFAEGWTVLVGMNFFPGEF
ncbi:MAG: hypothetical protein HYY44_02225 [Deltaproteobacteria bacterium]|nr:hypothetical protein [Deltaproteobacteria bacterium]MBI4373962.1 hypothetical protein [Deltaproteobacteria bacterium]